MTNLKECSPKLDDQTRIFLYPQLHVTRVPKMDQEYNYIILVTHEAKRAAFKFILMTASISNHRSTPYRNCLKFSNIICCSAESQEKLKLYVT